MGISKNIIARMSSLARRGSDQLLAVQQQVRAEIISVGAESGGNARKVVVQVVDGLGRRLKGSRIAQVTVPVDATPSTTLAGSDEFESVISGGASANMVLTTQASTGLLGFTVTDAAVESIVIKVEIDGCPPIYKQLSFA